MSYLKVKISDKVEKMFRQAAMSKFGYKKGALSLAAKEALTKWVVKHERIERAKMFKRCIMCKGKLEKKKVDYTVAGVNLGKFLARVCRNCGEQYFDELTARKMTELAKKSGVFGIVKKQK